METLRTIARIESDFPEKFGIPRQSGVVKGLRAAVVFEPEYRSPDALRGLESFSHIWLVWGFSGLRQQTAFAPTVRPPRLGGNERVGVFATRSPNRPNPIGLSAVQVERLELCTPRGPVIHVLGADLMDGTPIYDIKPYLPYTDSLPHALGGFAGAAPGPVLSVEIPEQWLRLVPPPAREPLRQVLACDPRPPYQNDPGRVYGMAFAGLEIKFTVRENALTVTKIANAGG